MAKSTIRILVIDDQEDICKFLKEKLTSCGWEVTYFTDEQKAMEQFKPDYFNIGIIDLKLPSINGLEIFKKLKEIDPRIGIIILTGYPSVDSALVTLKNGAFDYIKKPFDAEQLKNSIKRQLQYMGIIEDVTLKINTQIGKRIKKYRKQKDWTLAQLSQHTNLSKSLISQLEHARNSASIMTLYKISHALGIKMKDLIGEL